ncbi:integral membrane protein [Rutstroemia sp. NJR-2017a WRK4]|nr:integral membrane protein [Rutstroemia sp. NJR-2017a WRK4]PQE11744.1 integral membrane protein [Rutstroemia sp. NJR-2017a WRK4]
MVMSVPAVHFKSPHYYEKAGPNLAVAIALPILATIVVFGRIYVRRKQKLPLGIDDWLMIPALVLLYLVLLSIQTRLTLRKGIARHGLGYPTPHEGMMPPRTDLSTINPAIVTTAKYELLADGLLQSEYAMLALSTPALGCIKMSVLFFYHRIFCPNRTGTARLVIIGMMVLVSLWTMGFGFTVIFPCKVDFNAWWGPTEDLIKKCISPFDLLFALTLSDFITDALVLIIPLPLLWKLQLSTAKKISVSAVFLLGTVAVAASLTRLVFVTIARNITITGTLYWLMVELGLGLIAACLPTISFLFKGLTTGSLVSSLKMRSARSRSRSRVYSTQHSQQRNMSTASHAELAAKREEVAYEGKSYELQERRTGEDV